MFYSTTRSWFTKRLQQWMAINIPPSVSTTLTRRNIFILPTGNGLMFLVAAAVIFLAAINYEISLAFGLAFFMVSVFLVAMFYTFSNLHYLKINGLPTAPVFNGEVAGFQVKLSRSNRIIFESLELSFPNSAPIKIELVEQDQETVSVFIPVTHRGRFRAPRLRISSTYPLGLFRAWSVVDMNQSCVVYPQPAHVALKQLMGTHTGAGESSLTRAGTDDFSGLRSYVVGDSLKHVSWKNVARGQGMLVKQFVDYVDDRLWLDWDMFFGFGVEERLSRLCYCVLKLSESEVGFGLKIPGVSIPPGHGAAHRLKVLEALAFFQADDSLNLQEQAA
jgi:uncharacterized protein (DUF58 family)